MEDLVKTWQGRRVFLTGHTGFKGSWTALWLSSLGAQVRGFALDPDTQPNLFSSANVSQGIDDVRGDIRNLQHLTDSMAQFAPEVVLHLAAQPLVLKSYEDPVATYAINVMGTVHLLEAVRRCPTVRAVVCVTTDKCYRNQEWVWPYRETDPLGGHDPYASSKACAELVASAYRDSFFPLARFQQHRVALATVRAGNVIGGGDWSADRLLPDLVRGFTSNAPTLIRNPLAVRPWQHVLDPLYGYLLLAGKLLRGETSYASAFNFGPAEEDAWPVQRVANKVVELWGAGASWTQDPLSRPHEARLLRLDSSRAHNEIGWKPRLNIDHALDWSVHWYKKVLHGEDPRKITLDQIAAYQIRV